MNKYVHYTLNKVYGKSSRWYQYLSFYRGCWGKRRVLSICVSSSSNAKPILPAEILNPPQITKITIMPGSSQPSQTKNFVPKEGEATLGSTNKVVWTNTDTVPHSVTSDNGYKDLINGQFNSIATIGLVLPQKTYQFTFTTDGQYAYHCEPHPWMTGKIVVGKGKF